MTSGTPDEAATEKKVMMRENEKIMKMRETPSQRTARRNNEQQVTPLQCTDQA